MQLFFGTITFDSAPIDTSEAVVAKGTVSSISDSTEDTPVSVKAFGQTGTRMLNIGPGTRIQVVQGTINRGKNFTYIVQVSRYIVLPSTLDSEMYPDWHEVVLAGRTVKDLDLNDNRQYYSGDNFETIKRDIAVNQGKDKADFFTFSTYSKLDARFKVSELVKKYVSGKGTYVMVRGVLSSRRAYKPNSEGVKPLFTEISCNQLFLGPKTSSGPSSNGNGYSSNGHSSNGHSPEQPRVPQAYLAAPLPGAQPQVSTDDDLPF
jgi:single-stranded DNA-binding protein